MPASMLGIGGTTLTFPEKLNFIVVPKQVLVPRMQEADPHTESRYFTDLQFCAERCAG